MKYMVVVCLCNNRTSQIHRDFYNLWHAVTHETVSEWEQQRNTMWNFWSMIWLEAKQVYIFFMDTLKSIESIKWIQFKMKMDGHFFLYVVESWPINEQASDRLLFFLSTAFDAGIINHLFILSIKYDKIITDRLFFGNHTTPLFGKSSNRCTFSLFSLKALHFTPTTRFYKSICIFFFEESSILIQVFVQTKYIWMDKKSVINGCVGSIKRHGLTLPY